ncbi:MAG: hypothetical protein HQK54_18330, partial [Oligoflexales bacterium]|nr:hypothetical protein [Oligoflexales bacterium]
MMENLVLRQQLIVSSRKHRKAPPLKLIERILFAISLFFIPFKRLTRVAVIVSPDTILKFHKALIKKKYQILFGSKGAKKPGRKGFDKDIVNLVIEIKAKNPTYGCPRISMLVSNITGISISEQTVRRILRKYYKPAPGNGPSWLSFIGNQIDSLWSVDIFRTESINLKTYWIMAVMDQYSRRIIGFSVQKVECTGASVCHMFNEILSKSKVIPKRISTDNDPLFEFYRWKANLRILDIEEIKDKIYQRLEPSGWARVLRTFIYSKDFENIVMQLAKQAQDGKRFTPPIKNWFRAFEECPYDELKVVIVGQDPYPGFGQADGIAFSLKDADTIQPSLEYMFSAINKTVYNGVNACRDMDLTRWANQGMLMLN